MVKPCLLLSLMLPAAAQRFASFDAATASSVYSSKTFGADLATAESSGYWCSAGNHEPGQAVSWTGSFQITETTARPDFAVELCSRRDQGAHQRRRWQFPGKCGLE